MSNAKDKDRGKDISPITDLRPYLASRGLPDLWQLLSGQDLKVEEYREDDSVVIRAELPGVDPDQDIEVSVSGGVLHISAQRSFESKHEDDRSYRSEFRYGSFSRRLQLPSGATGDDVKASYRDGILEVRVPIDNGAAETQKVPISR